MLCPLGFKLLDCRKNEVMLSPWPSSHDVFGAFQSFGCNKAVVAISSLIGNPSQWLRLAC
jgi:hypothetical protein